MLRTAFLLCLCSFCCSLSLWAQTPPIEARATPETRNLFARLQALSTKSGLFGHQEDLAYGVNWQYEPGRSTGKDVTGDYPAVFGWDLGKLEFGQTANLDSVPFDRMRAFAQQVYAQGGVNTFSWHLSNPVDPAKTSWDKADSTLHHLFGDRKARRRYKSWLDEVAVYFKRLKGPNGEAIPVIFRPFHELTGNWFWWGRPHCTTAEYINLWRFTVDYLRDKKKVPNLLYAYSTDRFTSRKDYLERYPGDAYVDIIGFDLYHRPPADTAKPDRFIPEARRMVETLQRISQERKKVRAITETGLGKLPMANWWTQVLLPVVQNAGLSYVLVWRNARPGHFYALYPGRKSAEDFRAFYKEPTLFFGQKTAAEQLYKATQPR